MWTTQQYLLLLLQITAKFSVWQLLDLHKTSTWAIANVGELGQAVTLLLWFREFESLIAHGLLAELVYALVLEISTLRYEGSNPLKATSPYSTDIMGC
jgi:hypothetical protein